MGTMSVSLGVLAFMVLWLLLWLNRLSPRWYSEARPELRDALDTAVSLLGWLLLTLAMLAFVRGA